MSLEFVDSMEAQATRTAAYAELEVLVDRQVDLACEDLLSRFSGLLENRDWVLELIYLEYVLRKARGQNPTSESFQLRFPQLRHDIAALLEVDSAIGVTDPAARGSTLIARDNDHSETGVNSDRCRLGRIGDYEIVEMIGRGGMGVVYRAIQSRLNRAVAIKTIDALASFDRTVIERFQAEAETVARLQHPNIVQIHEVGTCQGIPYFSMELITGGTLAQATRARPLPPETAARLLATLARAVGYAHGQGVIHRDLKPANILLAPSHRPDAIDLHSSRAQIYITDNAAPRVEPKIADFGLAKNLESRQAHTVHEATLGTPCYMAPEQIDSRQGLVGPQSDVYSLGAILYDVLVGRPPFCAATALETLRQVREDDLIPLRELQSKTPRELETICLKCLSRNPADRYSTAGDLADDLDRFLNHRPIRARPAGLIDYASKWAHRHPSLATLLVSITLALFTITWLWRHAESSRAAEKIAKEFGVRLLYARDISLAHLQYRSHNIDRCRELLERSPAEFRNWEWHHLRGLCDQAIWESPPGPQSVTCSALSPDGRYVAWGCGQLGYDKDQIIRVWDTWENKQKWELAGHPASQVCSVNFSPDGTHLISSAVVWTDKQKKGGVFLWSVSSGQLIRVIADTNALAVEYSPDGKSLLVGNSKGLITQYSSDTGDSVREYQGHGGMVLDLSASRDGKLLVSSARDGTVAIWNVSTGRREQFLRDQGDPRRLALSLDGQQLIVADYSGRMKYFSLTADRITLSHTEHRRFLAYIRSSPDGRMLATAVFGEGAEIRDWKSGQLLREFHGHRGHVRTLAFDASGRRLVTGGADGVVRLWDLTRTDTSTNKGRTLGDAVASITYHPTQPLVALATKHNVAHGTVAGRGPAVELRDSRSLSLIRKIEGHSDWLTSVEYRRDGEQIITGSLDKSVRIWNSSDGASLVILEGHTAALVGAMFLGDGQQAVSMDQMGRVIVWEIVKAQPLQSWETGIHRVCAVALHSQKPWLAVASQDGEIRLWDFQLGKLLGGRTASAGINFIAFSPDGDRLAVATAQPDIEVWNTSQFVANAPTTTAMKLHGHSDSVMGVSFSPDGQRLSSCGRDETVRVFDMTAGHELLVLEGGKGKENIVRFSADGKQLIRADAHRLMVWNVGQEWAFKRSDETIERAAVWKWHQQSVRRAIAEKNDLSAIFHHSALIDLEPENREQYFERAISKSRISDWEGAEADLRIGLEFQDSVNDRVHLARICLKLGKWDEYRLQCKHLTEQVRDSTDPKQINNAAWVCCLSAESGVDPANFVAIVEKVSPENPESTIHSTVALLQYRMGNLDAATVHARKSLKANAQASAPCDWLILALANAQRQDLAAAKRYLDLVATWRENQNKLAAAGLAVSPNLHSADEYEIPLFVSELKSLGVDSIPESLLPHGSP